MHFVEIYENKTTLVCVSLEQNSIAVYLPSMCKS